jgi:N-acetylglucosamine kinase-like BadF-type ATPase
MKLIADSGSTKTDWALLAGATDDDGICRIATQGINPVHQSEEEIVRILNHELLPQLQGKTVGGDALNVEFYGAGCAGNHAATLTRALHTALSAAPTHEGSYASETAPKLTISVASDLLAAARALCRHDEGIACILGTGANSCLYDGRAIVKNIPPLGYILGDEGSGAVLGKLFLNALYKEELSATLLQEFLEWLGMTYADIIREKCHATIQTIDSLPPMQFSHVKLPREADIKRATEWLHKQQKEKTNDEKR